MSATLSPQRQRPLTDIGVAAVQDGLVATAVLANVREGLDDALTKLFALLGLVDGNVLDVTDGAETAEELALDEDAADTDDAVAGVVDDDEGVVCPGHCAHGVELVHPGGFTEVVDDGEDGEDIEMTAFVVCGCERADL
jgi:hypothetical protein